ARPRRPATPPGLAARPPRPATPPAHPAQPRRPPSPPGHAARRRHAHPTRPDGIVHPCPLAAAA
ncbi:MAG: hypothetical protein LBD90_04975, partial [Bifidobacteriaceae bacterium]|nr:hypothetical protein [Bifidobacteriaceae bacterium]